MHSVCVHLSIKRQSITHKYLHSFAYILRSYRDSKLCIYDRRLRSAENEYTCHRLDCTEDRCMLLYEFDWIRYNAFGETVRIARFHEIYDCFYVTLCLAALA
jgi:hypothetical protein